MDLRHAARVLKRTPVFTLAVVLTLAVGIASAGAMFAIVYGVLLAPLPYGQSDRLVSVRLQAPGAGEMRQPTALYVTYAAFANTLDGIGFQRTGSTNVWSEGSDDVAESIVATWVTASMLPLLEVPPLLGRSFTAEEELRGGPDAVILSESEWRSRFGAAADVIGKTLMVNSVSREIVGVMPARFSFPTAQTRIWLPAKRTDHATVEEFAYTGVARLALGASAKQAQRELAAVLPRMADAFPQLAAGSSTATWLADVKPTPVVVPLRDEMTAPIARTLWMLAAAAGFVLLVAWANVANLLLIRADGRQSELAVRAALGASRLRTATHFLAEALLLGVMAGALALLAVHGAVAALVAFGPADVPRLPELGVGLPAIAFTASITLVAMLVCAMVPASRSWRASLSRGLREGARGASTGASRVRLRAAFTMLQIAVALVVTIGSALLLRTAHNLNQVHPGFDGAQVTTLRTQLPFARYDAAASVAFYARLTEAVRALPSVRNAGLTTHVPLGRGEMLEQTFRTDIDGRTRPLPVNFVDDGYFAAMSIPLIAGRGFQPLEHGAETDVVISRQAAATLFGDSPSAAAVGKRLTLAPSGLEYTVIGVVADVRGEDLATPPVATVYRPLAVPMDASVEPATPRNMALVVQARGATIPAVRRIVQQLDPTVPVYNVETMTDVIRASNARLSFALVLMTAAAAITWGLGTLGLYGVMAYMVSMRSREFGVRVALGANPTRIANLVAMRGLALTAGGVTAGLALYALAAPFLRAFLFRVTVTDPLTLAATTMVIVATAMLASWLPARRAAQVDPAEALRAE